MLQNERLESFWGGLWLELWPLLYFHQFWGDFCGFLFGFVWIVLDLFGFVGPGLSQDTYLKKMRSAICYKMNVSRASGAACGSSYGRFCIFINFWRICLVFVLDFFDFIDCLGFFGPGLSQDTYLKKMRGAIGYKMNVSRASGAACGSSYARFCIFWDLKMHSLAGGPNSWGPNVWGPNAWGPNVSCHGSGT